MQQNIWAKLQKFLISPLAEIFLCGGFGEEVEEIFLFCCWTEISSESLSQSPGLILNKFKNLNQKNFH